MSVSPSAAQSAPVKTPSTPGMASAAGLVDRPQPRMGMGRPDDVGVGLTRQVDVVAELAAAGQKAQVLLAPDRAPDHWFHGLLDRD